MPVVPLHTANGPSATFISTDSQIMNATDLLLVHVWRVYRRLGLHHVSHRIIGGNTRVGQYVERVKAHLGYLERRRFVPQKALTKHYREVLTMLIERQGREGIGDYLEFGVYNGTSLICMYRALEELDLSHVHLFGFDSFEGLPPDEELHWGAGGRFSCDIETTRTILEREGVDLSRVTLIKGFFERTLTDDMLRRIRKASVIMVDCDLYRSTVECLAFSDRLIEDNAVVCFDDWYPLSERNMGEKRAFDEFLATRPSLRPRALASYAENARTFMLTRVATGSLALSEGGLSLVECATR
jgi:O-methyltransferase